MARRRRRKLKKSAIVLLGLIFLLTFQLSISGFRLKSYGEELIQNSRHMLLEQIKKFRDYPIRIRRQLKRKDQILINEQEKEQAISRVPDNVIKQDEASVNELPINIKPEPRVVQEQEIPEAEPQKKIIQQEQEKVDPNIIRVKRSKYIYNPQTSSNTEDIAPVSKADKLLTQSDSDKEQKQSPAFDAMMEKSYTKLTKTADSLKKTIEKTTGFTVTSEKKVSGKKSYSLEKNFEAFSLQVSPASNRLLRINKGEINIDYVHDKDDQVRVGVETDF